MPFDIAPVQIAFILIGENEELINYYQEIYEILSSAGYRCQLYNKSSRVNLNILQVDKEGCPFKIILGKEELAKEENDVLRRDIGVILARARTQRVLEPSRGDLVRGPS